MAGRYLELVAGDPLGLQYSMERDVPEYRETDGGLGVTLGGARKRR